MRIAHVIDYFQPQVGYQETYLALKQQELGHDVHVVTSDRYHPRVAGEDNYGRIVGVGSFREEGILVHRLPCLIEYKSSAVPIIRNLRKTLKEIKPDVVHCHHLFSPTAFLVARCKQDIGYTLVYDTHAADFNTCFTDTLPKRVYHLFFRNALMPRIKKEADKIIAVGGGEREFVCREFGMRPEDVDVIPLGADTDLFRFNEKDRENMRKKLGLNEDSVLLIHAGKLSPGKNIQLLLDAVASLMHEKNNLKLLLIGRGDREYINELRRVINAKNLSEQVIFHDFVKPKELPGFYSAADIGVWPGDPSAGIQEAMSVGLPLVVAGMLSVSHLTDRDFVLSFPRDDVEKLRDRVNRLVVDSKLRLRLGSESRVFIEKEFSWDTIARKFINIYERAG